MTPFSRHQQFHLAAVGPWQCHRTSAKKRPCQPPSDRPNQSPRMATQLFVGFCMEQHGTKRFWFTKKWYKVYLSQSFSVNKLHIQPCIGVCANLLEVVEVATPLQVIFGNGKTWETPRFQQTHHLKVGNSWEFSIAILGDFCQRVNHLWFRVSLSWEDHRMKYSASYGHSFSLAKWFRAAHRRRFEFPNLAVCHFKKWY